MENRTIHPLGSTLEKKVEVINIITMNERFSDLIEQERILLDFRDRVAGNTIFLPSLEDRKEDIPDLVYFFLDKYKEPKEFITEKALQMLINFHYPGNIRDLKTIVEMAIHFSGSSKNCINSHCINKAFNLYNSVYKTKSNQSSGAINHFIRLNTMREFGEMKKRITFQDVVEKHNYNVKRIAEELKKDTTNIYRRMKKYGIERS